MKETTSNKKNHVVLAILSIIVIVLIAAVYLQGKRFSKFMEGLGEKSVTEIKADSSAPEKSEQQDDEGTYQKKITKLETRITDMQEKQDNLEETLNEYGEKDTATASEIDAVSQAKEDFNQRRGLSTMYKDFIKQNNYPPELSEKLADLYIEKNKLLYEHMMKVPEDWENPKDWSKNKEFNRQTEEINTQYDKKIAELLPGGGLALFKEYENRSMERSLVYQFEMMLGDDTLEKEKERKLIDLLYKDTQTYTIHDKDYKDLPNALLGIVPEKKLDEETVARLTNEYDENLRKTYEAYTESAEGILSDSQMVKFEGFVNLMKKVNLGDDVAADSSEKEKGER